MNVIVTLAGHSRRFKKAGYTVPKFMIELDGRSMISQVVEMFDPLDNYFFVLNRDQVREFPEIEGHLRSLAKNVHIQIIESHEHGPIHSALAAKPDLDPNDPVIITYCDFKVVWDYPQFLRQVYGYDAAAPCFRGFHPASFGHTYYAYVRTNEANELIELREKKSFTNERHNEWASSGIYYFKDFHTFETHAAAAMSPQNRQGLAEGYVSLVLNPIVNGGGRVKITGVERFICWGTPEDVGQYVFWSKYMTCSKPKGIATSNSGQVNLIPMAGRGSRFRTHGYRTSKPLIVVEGQPMIVSACASFPPADKWVFLAQRQDLEHSPVVPVLNTIGQEVKVIPVDGVTSGQAATCMLAEKEMRPEKSLFIASCDYKTIYDPHKWQAILDDETIDGAVWTFKLGPQLTKSPDAFAWCVTKLGTNEVTAIKEKAVISDTPENDPLVVGSFWFRRASDFVTCATHAITNNIHVNGEHYVANSMNMLFKAGKKFVIFPIEQWISFGDPFELQVLEYWSDYFHHMKGA